MASKAATNFPYFCVSVSTGRSKCIRRLYHHICYSRHYEHKTTMLDRKLSSVTPMAMFQRSLSRTRFISKSTGLLSTSVKCAFMSRVCVKTRKNNYSTHAQRPRSKTYFYDVLSITPNATQSQIKNAYYEMSKVFHPDINKEPSAHVRFAEISEAYEVLGNSRKRRLYDRGVLNPQTYKDDEDGFHTQEGFKSKKRQAPRGHTNIYNFDEFYRQHYGESRKKHNQRKAMHEAYLRELEREQHQKRTNMIVMFMMLIVFIAAWYSAKGDLDNMSKPKKKKD